MPEDENISKLQLLNAALTNKIKELEGYERVFNLGPLMSVVVSAIDGTVMAVNDEWLKLNWLSREEIIGQDIVKIPTVQAAANLAIQQEIVEKLHRHGKINDYELKVPLLPDGQTLQMLFSFEWIEFKGQRCILGTGRDVTEAKQHETLLHLQRDLVLALNSATNMQVAMDLIIDTMMKVEGIDYGGIYLIDPQSGDLELIVHRGLSAEFTEVSKYYKRDTPEAQLVHQGKCVYEQYKKIFPLEHYDSARRQERLSVLAVIPVLDDNKVIACINLGTRRYDKLPAATRHMIETIAAQLGVVLSRIQSRLDMERRAAELLELTNKLTKLNRSKDEFTAMISHELRTPLVTGLGYVEMLLNGSLGPITNNIGAKMQVAYRNLKRLNMLIDDMLKYRRFLDQDFIKSPHLVVVNLQQLCEESLKDLFVRHPSISERMHTKFPQAPLLVLADEEMIRMVLQNLLNNALKHAGPDASMWLEIEEESAEQVQVTVRDNGAGMPAEIRERAFEPYIKSAESQDGFGLGLAIVKAIIDAHQSKVSLTSSEGLGTVISFSLARALNSSS